MSATTTRAEHLQWCKDRALACLDEGKVGDAISSMLSDIQKHEETRNHVGIHLIVGILAWKQNRVSDHDIRHWIVGFN